MRIFWAGLGWIALACGLIGAVLPLIPTVPFVLLAAFAFARSSERVHDWLLSHPVFGPSIVSWRERGAISLTGKRWATASFVVSIGLGIWMGLPPYALAMQGLALAGTAAFIWSRPSA
ncbi:YbaN family protein [Frigidibacter sp.]|uniref:YbaN family protein n=1 Tax=Frigidibacter sp. TaxID=2586418 RepID=UPI002732C94C|nr:YbaN family protein [Frigidibacter sp.]MDP3339177.1 YbaN family protein [Frigidibacter sp.]